MQDLSIAYIQTSQFWQDKEANYAHFSEKLAQLDKDADLVLLPEMFNTSFSMDISLAEDVNGASVQWMIQEAKKGNFHLGATLMIKKKGSVFNRFIIVNSQGVVAQYNKIHLFSHAGETEDFTKGKGNTIVELKGWKILMKVCYDLRFPIDSRNNAKNPYDLAIYLANWPTKRSYAWHTLIRARAIENQAYVVGVNRIGRDGNDHAYDGKSGIYDPWGNVIHESADKDEIHFEVLKYSELEKIRLNFNTLNDEFENS